jgi:hypothetical protein
MLRLTALFCFLVLAGCTGGGNSQPNALLPASVRDEIISRYYAPENNRGIEIEITGTGTVLPYEETNGVDKVLCLKIRYEREISPDSWVQGISSRIIFQTGEDWSVNNALQGVERAWIQHSCPGTYESVVPE